MAKKRVEIKTNKPKTDKQKIVAGVKQDKEKLILEVLGKWGSEWDEMFESYEFPRLSKARGIFEGYVPPEWSLKFKYFVFTAKTRVISASVQDYMTQYANVPYWNELNVENNTEKREEAKMLDAVLKKEIYGDNKHSEVRAMTILSKNIYGLGIEEEGWTHEERDIDFIDIEGVEEIVDEETGEVKEVKYEEIAKTRREIVKSSILIRNVNIFNWRPDPTANSIDECRGINEKMYMSDDDILENFSNYEDYLDGNPQKESDSGTGQTNDNYFNKDDRRTSEDTKKDSFKLVRKFYVYKKYLFYVLCGEDGEAIMLLHPKNFWGEPKSGTVKYLMPYNHGQYPYRLEWYLKRDDTLYGTGIIDDIGDLNLAETMSLNLAMEGVVKKTLPSYAINPRMVSVSSFANAINNVSQFAELTNNNPNVRVGDAIHQLKHDYNTRELMDMTQQLSSYSQLMTQQTNFQAGGSQAGQYNKTLGGIQLILAESQKQASFVSEINKDGLKEQLWRIMANIFQFAQEDIVVQIANQSGSKFVQMRTKFNNQIPDNDVTPVKTPEGYEIYELDELAQLKYSFSINFAKANKVMELIQAVNLAAQYKQVFGLNINVSEAIKEIFDKMGLPSVVRDQKTELEEVEKENRQFVRAMKNAELLLEMDKITPDEFGELLGRSVEFPQPWENHQIHLERHLPDMMEHRAMHEEFLNQQRAAIHQMHSMVGGAQPATGESRQDGISGQQGYGNTEVEGQASSNVQELANNT